MGKTTIFVTEKMHSNRYDKSSETNVQWKWISSLHPRFSERHRVSLPISHKIIHPHNYFLSFIPYSIDPPSLTNYITKVTDWPIFSWRSANTPVLTITYQDLLKHVLTIIAKRVTSGVKHFHKRRQENWSEEKQQLHWENERKPPTPIHTHISYICIFNIQIRCHQDKFHLCISQISISANRIRKQKNENHLLFIVGLNINNIQRFRETTNALTLCNFQ